MKMLKVSKSFSEYSSARPRKNYGRSTRRPRDIQLKVEKSEFFKVFNPQNILMKFLKNVDFGRKTFLKVALENFQLPYEDVQDIQMLLLTSLYGAANKL